MRIRDALFGTTGKDGGPESKVFGFWLVRIKWLFTIALLRFDNGTREAYHTHAFNSWSWVLSGKLIETFLDGVVREHTPHWIPVRTVREDFHQVRSEGTTWVLTFRGRWADRWMEYLPETKEFVYLTHNRIEIARARVVKEFT